MELTVTDVRRATFSLLETHVHSPVEMDLNNLAEDKSVMTATTLMVTGALPFAKFKMTMNVWEPPPVYVGSSVAMGSSSLHLDRNAMTATL